jgi:hypothetical protein
MLLMASRSLPSLLDPERVLEVGNEVVLIRVNNGVRADGVTTRVLEFHQPLGRMQRDGKSIRAWLLDG